MKPGDWASETPLFSKVNTVTENFKRLFQYLVANTTVEEPVKLDSESRSKREVHEEDIDEEEDGVSDPEEKCRVDMWRCLSRVIEGGLHYIEIGRAHV